MLFLQGESSCSVNVPPGVQISFRLIKSVRGHDFIGSFDALCRTIDLVPRQGMTSGIVVPTGGEEPSDCDSL